jgi:hypothetical protein
MLDPFTALDIAGNIVQFISFTAKLITTSNEIHQSTNNASIEHLDLEAIANNLRYLSERLKEDLRRHLIPPLGGGTSMSNASDKRTEIQLRFINSKCSQEADALLAALRDLRLDGQLKKWQCFKQALKSVWKDNQIKGVVNRLSEYRKALDTELLFSLR